MWKFYIRSSLKTIKKKGKKNLYLDLRVEKKFGA